MTLAVGFVRKVRCRSGFHQLAQRHVISGMRGDQNRRAPKLDQDDLSAYRLDCDEQSLGKEPRYLFLSGANGRNLKSIDLKVPLNQFCVVTGVSGSGKSTLVLDTLVPAVQRALGTNASPLGYQALVGHEHISGVECIDASPVSQSKRSNPASFTKIFDDIRKLYAATLTLQDSDGPLAILVLIAHMDNVRDAMVMASLSSICSL